MRVGLYKRRMEYISKKNIGKLIGKPYYTEFWYWDNDLCVWLCLFTLKIHYILLNN